MTNANQILPSRIFKIGATGIAEDAATARLSSEQVRDLLKKSYSEVANAVIRERDENGLHIVEYLPQSGRKG